MKKRPFAIVAPLGVNIPSSIDQNLLEDLNNNTDWSFLERANVKLEVFGGNHMLDATKELLEESNARGTDDFYNQYFESRLCVIYYGLTTAEILRVGINFYKFINSAWL
jgi:hypothetical protein